MGVGVVGSTVVSNRDTGNQRTGSMTASQVFDGTWKEISQNGGIFVRYLSSHAPTSGEANTRIEFSDDGISHNGTSVGIIQRTSGAFFIGTATVNGDRIGGKYYRVHYKNGATPSTFTFIFAQTSKFPLTGTVGSIDDPISDLLQFQYVRAVQAGTRRSADGALDNEPISEHNRDLGNEQILPLVNGSPVTFTADDTLDTINAVGHGLVADQCIHFTTDGTLPAPLTAAGNYFVVNPTADTFQVATSRRKSSITGTVPTPVDLTDAGTGTHSYKVAAEFNGEFSRISDAEHAEFLYASLTPMAVVEKIWSGDGINDLDREFSDGVTATNTTLTSATAAFTSHDRGSIATGSGIPSDTRIVDVVSATQVTLSKATTASASGVTVTLHSPFSPGAMAAVTLTGYNVYYDINEGRNTAPFYRFHVVNGPSDQTNYPGFIDIKWLMKTAYQGSFGLIDAQLNQLSKALLTRAIIGGDIPDGTIRNASLSYDRSLRVADERIRTTHGGTVRTEGHQDVVSIDFSQGLHIGEIQGIVDDGSVNGTVAFDAVNGRAVFAVPSTPGSTCVYRSNKVIIYEPGHTLAGEQTLHLNAIPTGDGYVEWGIGDGVNGVEWRLDATGLYVQRRKNGVVEDQILQSSWNRDKCNGDSRSRFVRAFAPETLDVLFNNRYYEEYEWLGAAPLTWGIFTPNRVLIDVHTLEFPNSTTGTSLSNPTLPMFIKVANDTTSGQVLEAHTGSWRGSVSTTKAAFSYRDPNEDYRDVRAQGQFNLGSSTTNLAGNATFWGRWFPWQNNYVKAVIDLKANVPGTLYIDYSQQIEPVNGDNSSVDQFKELPYDPAEEDLRREHVAVQSKWMRVRYVNGPAAQDFFGLDVAFLTADSGGDMKAARLNVDNDDLVTIVDAIDTSASDDSDTGFVHVKTTRAAVSGKDGKNVTVTKVEDSIAIRPPPLGPGSASFVLGSEPQRIDLPDITGGLGARILNVRNQGRFHIFTLDDSGVNRQNGEVAYIAGNSKWALQPGGQLWGVCEDIGGSSQNSTVSGVTGSGTATDPGNAVSSDNLRAVLDAVGEYLEFTGYSFALSPGFTAIERVRIGAEMMKDAAVFETVGSAFATVFGATAGAGTVSTSSAPAGTDELRIVAVSRNDNVGTVNGVSQGGVIFSKLLGDLVSGNRRLDVWFAVGNFSAGVATATLQNSTNAHIAMAGFNNHDPVAPIEDFDSLTGTSTTPTTPALSVSAKGFVFMAISHTQANGTPGTGYTEGSDQTNGAGSNTDTLATERKAITASGSEMPTYTIASGAWGAISVAIRPRTSVNPVLTASYKLDGVAGATTGPMTVVGETDGLYYLDITPDFDTILESDIADIEPRLTVASIGSAAARVDHLFLEVRETSGATSRILVRQMGYNEVQ